MIEENSKVVENLEEHPRSEIDKEIDDDAVRIRDGRNLDLMAESFCVLCETTAFIDETAIDHDTMWITEECECGETKVNARVAPWPRDYMVEESTSYPGGNGE